MFAADDQRTRDHSSTSDSVFLDRGPDILSGQLQPGHDDTSAAGEYVVWHVGLDIYCQTKSYTSDPHSSLEDVLSPASNAQAAMEAPGARSPHLEVYSAGVLVARMDGDMP